jgi:hypothetical protein
MSYLAGEEEGLLDRVRKDVGTTAAATSLEQRWLAPASQRLREIARNRATQRIRMLRDRQIDWDGYGSAAADPESVFEALSLIESFIEQSAAAGINWVDPHIGLNEDGHVVFEWWNAARKLTVYIAPGAVQYVSSWGPNIESQMAAGPLEENQFAKQWRWLSTRTN